MIDNLKILDSFWYTQLGSWNPIGIVIVKDTLTSERKAYIGNGEGQNQKIDEWHIVKTGAKFDLYAALALLGG